MTLSTCGAFLAIALVVICTPGPDTALTVRNALIGGRRHGVLTAAGVAIGQAVWTVATAIGLAGLILAFEPAFVTMKLLGGAFLVFLGARSLLSAWRGEPDFRGVDPVGSSPARGGVSALWQGLLNDLANPKMAAFFISTLPQFADDDGSAFATMVALGMVFSLLTLGWLALYCVAIERFRRALSRTKVRRAMDAVAGMILVGFGVRLAASGR